MVSQKLKQIITVLSYEGNSVDKILLQKFIFFYGLQTNEEYYQYEPHTYGPYSFELATDIQNLKFNNELFIDNNNISLTTSIDERIIDKKIKSYYDTFLEIVDGVDFARIEIAGTLMYCMKTLRFYGEKIDYESVKNEFDKWKGEKYSSHDKLICQIYDKIVANMPKLIQK